MARNSGEIIGPRNSVQRNSSNGQRGRPAGASALKFEDPRLPPILRFGGLTAYSEGWGLYSEELAKDMGFYTDPYSDFGRLTLELRRAIRLRTRSDPVGSC